MLFVKHCFVYLLLTQSESDFSDEFSKKLNKIISSLVIDIILNSFYLNIDFKYQFHNDFDDSLGNHFLFFFISDINQMKKLVQNQVLISANFSTLWPQSYQEFNGFQNLHKIWSRRYVSFNYQNIFFFKQL